jgi:hypothetical protein
MPQQNIGTYFETTGATAGRGIAGQLYDGWAICNGNNLTSNDSGRVSIAYGTGYTTLGTKDGSKDAVLISHTHFLGGNIMRARTSGGPGNLNLVQSGQNFDTIGETQAVGTGDGINKNMQPYVVELKIQRIA